MAKMPEEGRFEYGKMDKQTGAQWVHVTPEMARAHPQGRLNLALWLIVMVFALIGFTFIYGFFVAGGVTSLIQGLLALFTAITLAMRAPIAVMLAAAQIFLNILLQLLGGTLKDLSNMSPEYGILTLVILIFSGLSLFYLIEGERPNLIYRHRFRSFRGKQD